MNRTAIAICEENWLIEDMKRRFMNMGKDELAEILAILSVELVDNGVAFGCETVPQEIEGVKAKYIINPIRDTFYINFRKHDSIVLENIEVKYE